MDYCRQGWMLVFVGTLFFAIGGLIATYGWNIWSHQSDKKKYLREGAWDIIRGTIFVALAGLLTTHGWNIVKLGEQRINLIRSLAQELRINVLSLEDPPLKGEVYYRKDTGDLAQRPFPTLKTTALNAVMSSGLWDLCNQTEGPFLDAVIDYEKRIGTANRMFDGYNDALGKIADPNSKVEWGKNFQRGVPEKDYFRSLEGAQNKVIKLLLSEYKKVIPLKLCEVLRQKIQDKPPVIKSEDVNKPEETILLPVKE